jgi:hypothetical protein
MLTVTWKQFDFGTADTNNDRITFKWTNAQGGAARQLRRKWF